jgi:hypothetical protein
VAALGFDEHRCWRTAVVARRDHVELEHIGERALVDATFDEVPGSLKQASHVVFELPARTRNLGQSDTGHVASPKKNAESALWGDRLHGLE